MTGKRARRPVAALTLGYLLAVAAIFRGFFDYHDTVLTYLIVITVLYGATFALGGAIRRKWKWGGHAVGVIQVGLMVWAFAVAPFADTWALLVLPTCIMVNQDYSRVVGWVWVALASVVMSAMIVYGHGWLWGPQFFGLYTAAYILVGAYSMSLKRAELANETNVALLGELRDAHARMKKYAEGVADLTAMRERNRLARDLHDSVTQTIFSMTLITQSSLILQKRGADDVSGNLEQLNTLAQSALSEMRQLISELRDPESAATPLGDRIRQVLSSAAEAGSLKVETRIDDDLPAVGSALGQEISSIVQEALNNVLKHASASEVTVTVRVSGEDLLVTVDDNGIGFDRDSSVSQPGHIGLSSMSERAGELGAQLAVTSRPGEGTAVELTLPLKEILTPGADEETQHG